MLNPEIVIIILNWNGLENTRECLNSLKKINYPNFKIFLVDNGSQNNEGAILKKEYGDFTPHLFRTGYAPLQEVQPEKGAGFITLIQNNKNLGFAEGNNISIEKALKDPKIKYVLTLNNDTIVDVNFITEALKKFDDSKIKMVAPRIMNYYQKNKIDCLGIQLTKGGLSFDIKNNNSILFAPCGGASFYARELLEAIKSQDGYYFDSDFFAYAEDLDLGFRAHLQGFNCALADKSIIYHKGSASTKIMSNLAIYHTYRNIIWVLIKNLPLSLWLAYSPKIILGQLAIIFLWAFRKKPLLILKTYFSALLGMPKMLKKRKIIQKNKKISTREINKNFTTTIFVKSYLSKLIQKILLF